MAALIRTSHRLEEGHLIMYIDGYCINDGEPPPFPRQGGFGVYFGFGSKLNISGSVRGFPTQEVAEIQAAIAAVNQCLKIECTHALIKSDSEQFVTAMNELIEEWEINNWWTLDSETGEETRIPYEDSYKELLEASKDIDVKYVYIERLVPLNEATEDEAYDKMGNDAATKLAKEGAEIAPEYY